MAGTERDLSVDQLADYHDALAHPARVTILHLLRDTRSVPMADLRRAVSERHGEIDTRTLQHHVDKMHRAGIVDVERLGGRYRVHLVRDIKLRVVGA